ncbi:hypothetical protein ABIA22_004659 [Sinorhizobium fredii]|uniref:hypothetical protein n=1 Tax=Rhizobium fredii TaxID=380 RepID=UPI00351737FE
MNPYIAELQKVPPETRNFVGLVAKRMHKLRNNQAVSQRSFGTVILASDVAKALQLKASEFNDFVAEIEGYQIGDIDEIDTDVGQKAAIRLRNIGEDWAFWIDLAEFCEKASVDMTVFTHDLDFARLDG